MASATESEDKALAYLKALIAPHPNFPIDGVLFHDVFPIFRDAKAFEMMITLFLQRIGAAHGASVDAVVGLDARGFLLGPTIAARLGCAFVPIRKKGKLPGKTVAVEYGKEYGKDIIEIQQDSIKAGQKCIIVDDLLATGGTLTAAVQLVNKIGGEVLDCMVIVELPDLKGRGGVGAPCFSLFGLPSGC